MQRRVPLPKVPQHKLSFEGWSAVRIAAHPCAASRPRRRSCRRAPQRGDELSALLPIFDFGDASRSTAQAT